MVKTLRRIPLQDLARELLGLGYEPARDPAIDFASEDGTFVLEVLARPRVAVRDLRATFLQLAALVAGDPRIERACAVMVVDRLTQGRIQEEWHASMSVLRPQVARRLGLVAVGNNFRLCFPDADPRLAEIAEIASGVLHTSAPARLPRLAKSLEVLKVLLVRRLLGQGPMARGALGEAAGCSYATVAQAVERFRQEIREHSDRSVELRVFPQDAWNELLALTPSHRARIVYADRTGRRADPEALLQRLQKLAPSHVALGGVAAARHWDPHFDLRGLPRLDLSLTAEGGVDLGFLRRLDPGLGALEGPGFQDGRNPPVLVVHPLERPAALFASADGLPIADPVETLLDLGELRLVDQANALIERLERQVRERR